MLFYEAVLFIEYGQKMKKDMYIGGNTWKFEESNAEDDFNDEWKFNFACELVNFANVGMKTGFKDESNEFVPYNEIVSLPVLFEDEIATILHKFTTVGSNVRILSPYVDGRKEKTIKIVKEINYFSGDKYSAAVVYEIYNAIENDYVVSINDTDILELRKQIEF